MRKFAVPKKFTIQVSGGELQPRRYRYKPIQPQPPPLLFTEAPFVQGVQMEEEGTENQELKQ